MRRMFRSPPQLLVGGAFFTSIDIKRVTLGIRAETHAGHRVKCPLLVTDFIINWIMSTNFIGTPRYEVL
jgi:hypothetical protein